MQKNEKHAIDVLEELVTINNLETLEIDCYKAISLKAGPRHNFRINASPALLREEINRVWSRIKKHPNWGLSTNSKVKTTSGDLLHIPMIDFRAKLLSNGQDEVRSALLDIIGKVKSNKTFPGYLLVSGESFHYIGLRLMTFNEWLEFMGTCLFCEDWRKPERPSPVDRRWIGWSLIRQYGSLRLFEYKNKPEPYVIEYFPEKS